MTVAIEKVSTVGVRNQVTLPRSVRLGIKITEKTQVFIQAVEKEDMLVITLNSPDTGVFNKIKISEKGQLVIPKNLRESKGITEGTNLVFSIFESSKIKVMKLKEQKESKPAGKSWVLLIDTLDTLIRLTDLKNVDVEGQSLIVTLKKARKGNVKQDIHAKLENLIGTRLMIEKLEGNRVKLTPLG